MLEWLGGPLGDGVCRASGCERGAGMADMAGYPGTWVRTWGVFGEFWGVLLRRTQHKQRVPRPAAWGVRGKPNELKRLDVPVPVPTSRPPLAIRNESATRAGTACSFIQGWLGSTHCLSSRPLSAQHRCTPPHSTAQHSKAKQINRKSSFSFSAHQNIASNLPSQHTLSSPTRRSRRRLVFVRTAFYCILHCVALCRSCSPVSLSLRVFSCLIDILWLPIITPYHTRPAFFTCLPFPPSSRHHHT